MTLFEEIAARNPPCEICGKSTIALYGGGWDNDLIYCSDTECGGEIVFSTSTEILPNTVSKRCETNE